MNMKPFRFWSQKILPLVYDDSLSYYEVLCKLTTKINEMIEFINEGISNEVKKYVRDIINKLIILYTYDSDNTRLIFGIHSTDENEDYCDYHEYDSSNETISIVQDKCNCNKE